MTRSYTIGNSDAMFDGSNIFKGDFLRECFVDSIEIDKTVFSQADYTKPDFNHYYQSGAVALTGGNKFNNGSVVKFNITKIN